MKKTLFSFMFILLALSLTSGQPAEKRYRLYGIAFYNQENLFDTIHDPGKNDWEYTPGGTMKWGTMKYNAKLKNMSEVLSQLCVGQATPAGAAVIGLAEVENRRVLEDLIKQPALADRGYEIVHYEGPDRRGIDCAFLYNPKFFHCEATKLVPYVYPNNDTTYVTRGFLVMSGRMAGEKIHFIVNHWPSRAAGSETRERAGAQVRVVKDSLLAAWPGSKVVIMGDMNDDPNNKSMTTALGCKHKPTGVGDTELYNPWWDMLYKKGQGTLMYDGKWNLFDQIVFTGNLLGKDRSTLKFHRNEVFIRDYLIQQEGKDKGNPKRTHASGVWLNGYSDHLPTLIYLVKEVQ